MVGVQVLKEQNVANLSFTAYKQELQRLQSEYGFNYYILTNLAIVTTIFFLSFLKPPKFYKDFISKIFNISFKWRGATWKVYHLISGFLMMLGVLLFYMKMQDDQFSRNKQAVESYENRLFRLKFKWILETEIWLLALVVIELLSIHRLVYIYDKSVQLKQNLLDFANEQDKFKSNEDSNENLPTKSSITDEKD
jgi:hypothetical protein